MTWSYSDPSKSPKDYIRFLIGDTMINNQLLSDEEIYAEIELSEETNLKYIASHLCLNIAAKFSRYADSQLGDYQASHSQIAKQFEDLAARLRRRAFTTLLPAYGSMDGKHSKQFHDKAFRDYYIDT